MYRRSGEVERNMWRYLTGVVLRLVPIEDGYGGESIVHPSDFGM